MNNWRINKDLRDMIIDAFDNSLEEDGADRTDLANKFIYITAEIINNCPQFRVDLEYEPKIAKFFNGIINEDIIEAEP